MIDPPPTPPPGGPPPDPDQAGPYRPPEPARRFPTGAVIGGIAADLPIGAVGTILMQVQRNIEGSGSAAPPFGFLVVVVPLALGIFLAVRGRTARVRGFGLGLAIGWAVWTIIGAGVCFGVLALMIAAENV